MEASRRSKRKPLSDCTNIIQHHRKKLPPPSSSKNPNSITLIQPPKPSNVAATTVSNKIIPPTSSSQKSHTSIGSSNSLKSVTAPLIPQSPESSAPPTPLSDSGGIDCEVSRLSADQSRQDDEIRRKEKGKMVVETPTILLSAYMTSRPLQIASSSATARPGIQAVQSQKLHAQTVKDKGKTAVNASFNQLPAPLISKHIEISSSSIPGSSLSKTSVARNQELYEERRKDKGKMVLETPHIEESEPSTPHAPFASPATSGNRDKPVTVYSERRGRKGRKHAVGKKWKNNLSSSHSEQRIRKTGLELDEDRSHKKGSHTDPLPVHKKKRSREKHGGSMHAMSQEEVDKLRAYYADIDAFELPEEVASESD